ncbi:MAG: DUF4129 domain-containing protein [Nitrospinae bacterium]|nr:DUF4129 domain-containing protein [Nitrospinota bacterium]
MTAESRRQIIIGLLLGATFLGVLLYLSGLASSVRLGDAALQGFLLVPTLPTPLYFTMGAVVLAGVGMTMLVSILHRRRRPPSPIQRQAAGRKAPWQSMLSMLVSLALVTLGLIWLMRHALELQQVWERLRAEVGAIQGLFGSGALTLVHQVSSPTTGYALFAIVVAVYGGIALLALWVLFEGRIGAHGGDEPTDPHTQRVHRAMSAGLRQLREHADPRQAIIACYARLEHLLEDHGVPAYHHLTPQEYMGAALRGLDLPLEAFAGLVRLFELARYSLHPLDDTARTAAITHLEELRTHLQSEAARGVRP